MLCASNTLYDSRPFCGGRCHLATTRRFNHQFIAPAGTISGGWHFAGTGDFDANGRSDILFVNDNGRASIWDNGQIGGAHFIAPVGTFSNGWHVADVGDYDGNGRSDILLRNDNSAVSIWDNGQVSGAHIIASAGVVPNDWHIV
jgi:hypothetical protein